LLSSYCYFFFIFTNLYLDLLIAAGRGVLAEVGEKDGSMVTVKSGRFGMYINWEKVNAKMPAEYLDDPSELPLDEAWSLIEEKAGSMPATKKKSGAKASLDLPPAPKRPLSAYLHFCSDKRPSITAKSLGATSKELARLWAETPEEHRLPYIVLAEASKKEYEEKKSQWQKACQEMLDKNGKKQPKQSKGSRQTTASSSPKRPKSAYLFFCAEKRAEVSQQWQSLGDISKELARLWAATNASDRKQCEEMAAADKHRYEKEKMEDKPTTSSKKARSSRVATKKKVTTKKRGLSAYLLFCAEHRKKIVDDDGNKLPLGETTKRLANMWNECDENTRARFVAEAEQQKQQQQQVVLL
jgi:hypothetical protein